MRESDDVRKREKREVFVKKERRRRVMKNVKRRGR